LFSPKASSFLAYTTVDYQANYYIRSSAFNMDNPKTWRPQPKVYKSPPFTVEASGFEKVEGESIPRRNVRAKDGLIVTPEEGVATVFDILQRAARNFGNAKALGHRKLIRTHEETKKIKKTVDGKEQEVDKKWTYYELSEYSYISYNEYAKMALTCGAGLRKLGLKSPDRVHIFAATRSIRFNLVNENPLLIRCVVHTGLQ